MKTFISIMFLTLTSGCSVFYENKNLSRELNNKFNREIISNFSKALSRYPDNFLFYLERGRAKHDYGDYVGAIRDFKNSLSLNPDMKVMFHMANSKYAYGDHKGAIKDYEKLILKKDFKDQVFYNIASSHLILLNYPQAIENYTKSIEYVKDEENAYLNRGNAKYKIGDFLGSIEDYKKSLNINIKSYIVFNNILEITIW